MPEELIEFLRGKSRVLVVEDGMSNHIERELKAVAHDARLPVRWMNPSASAPRGPPIRGVYGAYAPKRVV